MHEVSFKTLWKIIKIVSVILVFSALVDYTLWVAYGLLIPSWTIATLSVGYTIAIFAVKKALEKEKCQT